ncbi:hypothetical protein HZ326_9119 [Fusarium oxysporum f. sp. albedinis]|nr:hypothetical protein HZ326_9119 [Fusarium oxysporum f. sp. albedinis]
MDEPNPSAQKDPWGRTAWLIGLRTGLAGHERTLSGAGLTSHKTTDRNCARKKNETPTRFANSLRAFLPSPMPLPPDGDRIGVMDELLDGGYYHHSIRFLWRNWRLMSSTLH